MAIFACMGNESNDISFDENHLRFRINKRIRSSVPDQYTNYCTNIDTYADPFY